jgi:hypothetical protein
MKKTGTEIIQSYKTKEGVSLIIKEIDIPLCITNIVVY